MTFIKVKTVHPLKLNPKFTIGFSLVGKRTNGKVYTRREQEGESLSRLTVLKGSSLRVSDEKTRQYLYSSLCNRPLHLNLAQRFCVVLLTTRTVQVRNLTCFGIGTDKTTNIPSRVYIC